jgi:hypothetical protein
MVAVAIVAILIGVGLPVERAIRFSRLASLHTGFESAWRRSVDGRRRYEEISRSFLKKYPEDVRAHQWRQEVDYSVNRAEELTARADYHGRMKAKYLTAARRPWLAVEPDPLPPKL